MEKIDIAIVGGGIMGLWSAYNILLTKPHLSVVIFEKEMFLGDHTTGRNSEVLHAGIYYDYNSLKHTSCIEGNRRWRSFFKEHQLQFNDCGKFIVSEKGQEAKLNALFEKGHRNGVPGIKYLASQEIIPLKRWVNCDMALYTSSSAVINVSASLKILARRIEELGGIILTRSEVEYLGQVQDGFVLKINNDEIVSQTLVNVAGHGAIPLRERVGLKGYKPIYIKGSYLTLNKKIPLSTLVYPIPPDHGMGLGVHLTLDSGGGQKFGPNTRPVSKIEYDVDQNLIEEMFPSIKSVFPTVERESLSLGYSGVRPRVLNEKGELSTDFVFNTPAQHYIDNYFEFLGIESPGLTAAPALAKLLTRALFN